MHTEEDWPSVLLRNNRDKVSTQCSILNTLMSSDPDAPEIWEIFPKNGKAGIETGPSHLTLLPTDDDVGEATVPSVELKRASDDRLQTSEQSIIKQEMLTYE